MEAAPKRFALIGAAGYIAPRHMQAIKHTGHVLVAALDKADSVGIMDRYFFDVAFFTEFERFDRFVDKLRRQGKETSIDYVAICSPNYLHDAHIRFALRSGADAIAEKPMVVNPWNLDAIEDLERETGRKAYTVLQLRLHPAILALRERVRREGGSKRFQVELTYITSRGNWYFNSWKGETQKSGGIAINIGIHFFDMLLWIFGPCREQQVFLAEPRRMSGNIALEAADVKWYLSLDRSDLPPTAAAKNRTTFRSLRLDGEEIEFTEGFGDLHTKVYEEILAGNGSGITVARPSIELVHKIRNTPVLGERDERCHPLLLAAEPAG